MADIGSGRSQMIIVVLAYNLKSVIRNKKLNWWNNPMKSKTPYKYRLFDDSSVDLLQRYRNTTGTFFSTLSWTSWLFVEICISDANSEHLINIVHRDQNNYKLDQLWLRQTVTKDN